MKILKPPLLIIVVAFSLSACSAQTSENQNTQNSINEDIQVFYFHNTKRCATCTAVEHETKTALEMFYANKMKAGTMAFTSLNLEEEEGKELAKSLRVSGQTLLIVKGETQLNLTSEGFMNARTNPNKFHEILKTKIDQLL